MFSVAVSMIRRRRRDRFFTLTAVCVCVCVCVCGYCGHGNVWSSTTQFYLGITHTRNSQSNNPPTVLLPYCMWVITMVGGWVCSKPFPDVCSLQWFWKCLHLPLLKSIPFQEIKDIPNLVDMQLLCVSALNECWTTPTPSYGQE